MKVLARLVAGGLLACVVHAQEVVGEFNNTGVGCTEIISIVVIVHIIHVMIELSFVFN